MLSCCEEVFDANRVPHTIIWQQTGEQNLLSFSREIRFRWQRNTICQKKTNPDLDNLILNCPAKIPQSTSNLQEERTCTQESKMGNALRHHHPGQPCPNGYHSVGQAPVGHPSGHHSVGQAAGPAETEDPFNNHMERMIGKTWFFQHLTPSILDLSSSSGAFALWWLEKGANTGLHIDQAIVAFTVLWWWQCLLCPSSS